MTDEKAKEINNLGEGIATLLVQSKTEPTIQISILLDLLCRSFGIECNEKIVEEFVALMAKHKGKQKLIHKIREGHYRWKS